MVLQFCVQNSRFAFRERITEVQKARVGTAASLLTSFIADVDVITDWLYFIEISNRDSSGDDEVPVPTWIRILQLVSCICGTLSWMAISSDGRLVDWLRQTVWWILWTSLWVAGYIFYWIPRHVVNFISRGRIDMRYDCCFDIDRVPIKLFDKVNTIFGDGFRISSGGLLMVGIITEDLPQIIVTFLVEDAIGSLFGSDGISRSAYLNLVLATFDILHKLAEAWDTRKLYIGTGTGTRTFFGHTQPVSALAAVGINHIVSASNDGTARLWDIVVGKCTKIFDLDESRWYGTIARIGKNKIITVSSDRHGKIKLFDLESGECLKTIQKGDNAIKCAVVSNDGKYFLTSSKKPKEITRWDTETLEPLQTYPKRAHHLVMFDGGRFVSTVKTSGEENNLTLLDVSSGNHIQNFSTKKRDTSHSRVTAICKHGLDSFLVASRNEREQTYIDLFTVGQPGSDPIKSMTIEGKEEVQCLASIGGNLFVASNSDTADLWNISYGTPPLHTFEGHSSLIRDIVYLPEQRSIVTASSDETVKVWPIPNRDDIMGEEGTGDNGPDNSDIENQSRSDISFLTHEENDN